jgi:hypothetical protein
MIIRVMEAVRTSETSVDNHFTRQYIPEDNSEHRTRSRENLKSHSVGFLSCIFHVVILRHSIIHHHWLHSPYKDLGRLTPKVL